VGRRWRHRNTANALAAGLLACLASGCVLGPDYARPEVATPDSYRFAQPGSVPVSTLAEVPRWWRAFGDPELDALVEEGLVANQNLAIATARVDEFAARAGVTHAQAFPIVGYGASAERKRALDRVGSTYALGASASWELDLWGRIRRQDEAARANLLATEQARLGVALSLVSSTVSGYVSLRDLDERLRIAKATLAGRAKNVELFQVRLQAGAVSDYEMGLVQADYQATAATIPDIEQAISQQENALSVLVGRNPGPIRRGKTLEQLRAPPVPAGLPSELIARRPDILQAEQQLVASNALVGVARALYYPSLSLTGFGGTASSELDRLFSGPANTWSFVGQLLGPIFAGGAIDASNRQAEALREQALHAYQLSIQNGFRDVEDALVSIQSRRELAAAREAQVKSLQRTLELVRERYDNGYDDYLAVIDAEQALFAAQLSLTAAHGDGYRALVDLYLALGGDWIEQVAPLPDASPAVAADANEKTSTRATP
jgi:multidrug efflux system outer membrane protein